MPNVVQMIWDVIIQKNIWLHLSLNLIMYEKIRNVTFQTKLIFYDLKPTPSNTDAILQYH